MIFLCVPIFTAVSLNLLSSECNILVLVTINIAQLIVILRCVTFGAETREWKGLDCETLAGFHVSATSFFFLYLRYALTKYLKQVQVILGLDNSEQTHRF